MKNRKLINFCLWVNKRKGKKTNDLKLNTTLPFVNLVMFVNKGWYKEYKILAYVV